MFFSSTIICERHGQAMGRNMAMKLYKNTNIFLTLIFWFSLTFPAHVSAACVGYAGPGGPCSIGPGGGMSMGPGGGLSMGPGGGLSMGPNPWRRLPTGNLWNPGHRMDYGLMPAPAPGIGGAEVGELFLLGALIGVLGGLGNDTVTVQSQQVSAQTVFDEALNAIRTQDYSRAFESFSVLSESGYPEAQFNLGLIYRRGDGVMPDINRAIALWEQAASTGQIDAQKNLGILFSNGVSVPQDTERAFPWFLQAAKQGEPSSQYMVGLAYLGIGVDADESLSFHWMRQAARSGHTEAMIYTWSNYTAGRGTEVNLENAFYWADRAAEAGRVDAKLLRSALLSEGIGVDNNYQAANADLQVLARLGIAEAQSMLAENYIRGRGLLKNLLTGYFWLSVATQVEPSASSEDLMSYERWLLENGTSAATLDAIAQEAEECMSSNYAECSR
jgi:TPR repeat protein